MVVTFVEGAATFVGEGAVTSVEGAVTSVKGAVTSVGGAVTSVGKGSSAVGGGLFETAGVGVVDDVKGVDERDLRRRLMIYKLKRPLLSIYSLISLFNYSVGLSSWATLYSACGTDLLFLLKTYTPLYWSSCLSPLSISLLASLNICTLKLLKSF